MRSTRHAARSVKKYEARVQVHTRVNRDVNDAKLQNYALTPSTNQFSDVNCQLEP